MQGRETFRLFELPRNNVFDYSYTVTAFPYVDETDELTIMLDLNNERGNNVRPLLV
jgi:hypothetical protein